jgi:hypothetical protein
MNAIKYSQAISRVSVRLKTNVPETKFVSIIRVDLSMMVETELVYETSIFKSTLTWLFVEENFIAFIRSESFRSCVTIRII